MAHLQASNPKCQMYLHAVGAGDYSNRGYMNQDYRYSDNYGYGGPGSAYPYQTPSWGYVILYLTILIVGLVGNFIFCYIIKKCDHLHRTHHFFFLAISVMDMLACVLVIPFAIDASVNTTFEIFSESDGEIF